MRYFKTIVIPTDGCDSAKAGVLQGFRIAKLLGAHATVVISVDDAIFFKDECECESFDAAEEIAKEVTEAADGIDLGVSVITKEGDAKDVLDEIISGEEAINLICIGTKGHKDPKDVLIGTLHEHLLKSARLPVIIQPYFGKAYLRRFNEVRDKRITIGKHKVTILVTMDGSKQAEQAAYEAIQFANQLNVGVHLVALHVAKSLKDADGKEKTDPKEFMHIPEKAKNMGLEVGIIVVPEVRVEEDMARGIVRRAAELKADMLVMGTHGRTGPLARFIGNKTEAVLESVPVPVMVVPPELRRSTMDIEAEEFVDDAWDEIKK